MRTRGPAARANAAHSPATGNGVGGDDDMDDLYGGDDDEDDDHVGRGVEARGTSGGGGGGGGVGGGVPGVQMIKVEGRDALPNTSPITHTAIVSSTTTTAILCANLCVCVYVCICVCVHVCVHASAWLAVLAALVHDEHHNSRHTTSPYTMHVCGAGHVAHCCCRWRGPAVGAGHAGSCRARQERRPRTHLALHPPRGARLHPPGFFFFGSAA